MQTLFPQNFHVYIRYVVLHYVTTLASVESLVPSCQICVCFTDIVEDGTEMVMWIGQQSPPEFVMNVFGVNSQADINVDSVSVHVCTFCG